MSEEFNASLPASQPLNVPSGPLEVREGCHLVGHRNPASLLQCNTYIRTFDHGDSQVHVCVDPGSQFDYPVVEANINQLIEDIGELDAFSLNHQDPDVIGNAYFLCEANPNISVMVTEDVWRLAQHLLFQPRRIHFANTARSQMMVVGDRDRWQLVPTPFCHFRGAMAFYDAELRTLFSGDLFGGVNQLGRVQLHAEERDWAGIAQFHQVYMPTREAVRYAIRQIQSLSPPVEVIAPQHGHVIAGDLVQLFMERLYDLPVGHDLIAVELDESYLDAYRDVVTKLTNRASETLGHEEVLDRLRADTFDDGLETLLSIKDDNIQVDRQGYQAVVKVLNRLTQGETQELRNQLRSEVLSLCSELGVPIPPIGIGIEENAPAPAKGPDGIATQAWWME